MKRSLLLVASFAAVMSIAAAAAAFDPWQEDGVYEFVYRVDAASIDAEAGQDVSLWIPLAIEDAAQQVLARDVVAPFEHALRTDALGNRLLHLRWEGPAPAEASVVATTIVRRSPYRGLPASRVERSSRDDPRRHLAAYARVPLDGLIEQLAVQESKGIATDAEKIRAFYDYVVGNMRYAKDGDGWGQGDAIWACTEKYGNCTDFHSLFLGMARSQGIPARFVIGFPIPVGESAATIPGYHCWAEAWDPATGWVPFDASEAWKAKRFDDYFGTLPADRIAFTTGRDLVLSPAQQGDPLNYFIYPYAEVDGRPVEKVDASFRFRRIGSGLAAR